ncbi:uncharacterized protein J7T54_005007 [Emericellopsis cladophorae]|uniref:Uncharacterized protein n=1 Tax=Emericellopsis cladophorae TaxID=2686198 RepID=A0A9P9Y1N0_9HYPO|nr:uncharacterized protein J7T54_005007 [Emericellopsis cladophorae]KAI6781841.1 hypothetical protein J7T54_005007 [Emericellopsis cladophorae]
MATRTQKTQEMEMDLQARGKDHTHRINQEDVDSRSFRMVIGDVLPVDTYYATQQKDIAMRALDQPELLLMHAQGNDDSVASQRYKFMCMLHDPEGRMEAPSRAIRPEKMSSRRSSGKQAWR